MKFKYKYLFFLILFVISVFIIKFSGSWNFLKEESYIDDASNYSYVPIADYGTSIGLVNNERDKLIEEMNFKINEGEDFEETIAIVNQNSYKESYIIIPLVDYKQKNIYLGNKEQNKLKVHLNPGEIGFVPFSISNLDKGFHDFSFLIVPDPENDNLSRDYRISTTGTSVLSIRGTISTNGDLENNDQVEHEYYKLDEQKKKIELDGLFLTKNKDNLKPWLVDDFRNNDINFNIMVGNSKKDNEKFTLVSFLDWNQVEVNNNSKVFYGEIEGESLGEIKGVINKNKINTENDILNYITIFIPKPYEKVDSYDPTFFIESSARIGINNKVN